MKSTKFSNLSNQFLKKLFRLIYFSKLNLPLFILALFIFAGDSSAQKNAKVLENKLSKAIDSLYAADKVPGIIVGIWTPEFTYKKAVGKADLKTGVDRKFDDKIRIGSITKTFVATVILQLAEEGKLGLDDPLSKFYPEVPNSSNITIRQILDMTSGLVDYLDDPLANQSMFEQRMNKYSPEDFLLVVIDRKPYFAPGKGWRYSNGNYNILGMMIEKITGNKIEDEINNRIIKPLGLLNTSYPLIPEIEGQYSHGYMVDSVTGETIDVTLIEPSITWAAGCMISNVDDLKIYGEALAKGTMLSSKMQEERLKFVNTGVVDFVKYGLGIFSLGGFIGHNGGITGYNTTMGYHPELETMIIVSVNEFGLQGGVSDKIFTMIADLIYPEKNFFK